MARTHLIRKKILDSDRQIISDIINGWFFSLYPSASAGVIGCSERRTFPTLSRNKCCVYLIIAICEVAPLFNKLWHWHHDILALCRIWSDGITNTCSPEHVHVMRALSVRCCVGLKMCIILLVSAFLRYEATLFLNEIKNTLILIQSVHFYVCFGFTVMKTEFKTITISLSALRRKWLLHILDLNILSF